MSGMDDAPLKAIALRYDESRDEAPTVVAKGTGQVAAKILELAEQHGVAVHRDPILVASLAALELGERIPDEFYPVVAEILVFVHRMNRERGRGR